MKFKYSVIGDNSQENREWLEMLGYKLCPCVGRSGQLFTTENGGVHFADSDVILENEIGKTNSINCIGNTQLFQAVSAIRDGTDINQLFVDEMLELLTGEINLIMCERDDKKYLEVYTTLRKATLTELQDKFKL